MTDIEKLSHLLVEESAALEYVPKPGCRCHSCYVYMIRYESLTKDVDGHLEWVTRQFHADTLSEVINKAFLSLECAA